MTLSACARLAGVSHAAPKHHFGDVGGLLRAVAEQDFAHPVATFLTELDAVAGDLDEAMIATTQAYVGFAEANLEHFRITFRNDLINVDRTNPPAPMTQAFVVLTNVLLRQTGQPETASMTFIDEKSESLVNDIVLGWSFIHGFAHLQLEGRLTMTSEKPGKRSFNWAPDAWPISFADTATMTHCAMPECPRAPRHSRPRVSWSSSCLRALYPC